MNYCYKTRPTELLIRLYAESLGLTIQEFEWKRFEITESISYETLPTRFIRWPKVEHEAHILVGDIIYGNLEVVPSDSPEVGDDQNKEKGREAQNTNPGV